MKLRKGIALMCAAAIGVSAFAFGSGVQQADAATVVKEKQCLQILLQQRLLNMYSYLLETV